MNRTDKIGLTISGISIAVVAKTYVDYRREMKRARKQRVETLRNFIDLTDGYITDLKFERIIKDF